MYAIIIKEAAEYVIIDAYYKGRWRCDEKALKAYLAYMSGFDRLKPNAVDEKSILKSARRINLDENYVIEMSRSFENENMPKYGNFDPVYLADKLPQFDDGIITPPNSIIEVTPYCNYGCSWCYIPPRNKVRNEFYSVEQLRDNVVAPLINTFGAVEWCLTGGEPTVNPEETLEIARMISNESEDRLGRRPNRMYMLTTGFRIPEYIDRFEEAGINSYQISLSSPDPVHENLLRKAPRRVDSHAAALNAIDAVVDRGLQAEVNMIIQPQGAHEADNLYDIPEMIQLAVEHNVRMLRIIPAVPCGQAKENNILMSAYEYAEVARMVADGRKKAPNLIIDCPIDQRIEKDRSLFCRAGTLWLYFDFRGNVYPCNNLQEPENRVWPNTIKTDKADKIWLDSPLLQFMRDYRNDDVAEQCQSCSLRAACAGECRAMTWARYRTYDLSSKPENCFAEQQDVISILSHSGAASKVSISDS